MTTEDNNPVWMTEYGQLIKLHDMEMPHLHSAQTHLQNRLTDVTEKLDYLNAPMPEDCRLTEEAITEVYMLKCEKLLIERWQEKISGEIIRRQCFMNEGFGRIMGTFDPWGKDLPLMLQRQAD